MSDYDYCEKHDISFLMPELLMCPECAVERLKSGDVAEPIGDALIEAIRVRESRADKLAALLRVIYQRANTNGPIPLREIEAALAGDGSGKERT